MSRKNKELPKKLRDGYKKLPLKARMKLLVLARKVLEKQREKNTLDGLFPIKNDLRREFYEE